MIDDEQPPWERGDDVQDRVDIDAAIRRERVRQAAREAVRREQAEAAFTVPPYLPSLVKELAEQIEAPELRIDSLAYVGQNTLLSARAKAGKTTTSANLLRSLADGEPFLGSLAVKPPDGKIGYLNYEMSRSQFNTWLRDIGIRHPERVAVLHLRGYRLPLIAPVAQDFIVEWATECGIEILIADPWGRMMVGSGSENSNDDVRTVLEILGEIKRLASIADLFLIAHMGHSQFEIGQERARGASELLGWPDVMWNLTIDNGKRFLSAFGRDVDFEERELTYDPAARRLTLPDDASNRLRTRDRARIDEVVRIVSAVPGQKTSEVMAAMTTTTNTTERSAAIQAAKTAGLIHDRQEGRSKLLYPGAGIDVPAWEPRFEADA